MNRGRLFRYWVSVGATAIAWAAVVFAIMLAAQEGRAAAITAATWILGLWAVIAILGAPFERRAERRPPPEPQEGPEGGEAA